MAVRIKYTPVELASFKLVPETCPVVDRAIHDAFRNPNLRDGYIKSILAKYGITEISPKLHDALDELIGRVLFDRKSKMSAIIYHEGTFPLRAALVNEVAKNLGVPVGRNHFEEWVDDYHGRPIVWKDKDDAELD